MEKVRYTKVVLGCSGAICSMPVKRVKPHSLATVQRIDTPIRIVQQQLGIFCPPTHFCARPLEQHLIFQVARLWLMVEYLLEAIFGNKGGLIAFTIDLSM